MHVRLLAKLLRRQKAGPAVPPTYTVVGDASATGEAPAVKTIPERLTECIESTQGPADPADRERWLAEHAKGY